MLHALIRAVWSLPGTLTLRRAIPTRAIAGFDAGQALVEYTLILALIAIVALAALTQLGNGIGDTLNEITGAL
jgi:Flp pilus assembly pilin Flp